MAPIPEATPEVNEQLASVHQQQLTQLTRWQLTGQVAVFDEAADERHAVYLTWQQQPDELAIRFSHPLKGTLARVTEDATGAEFINDEDQRWYASSLDELLADHLQLALPVSLMQAIVTGREPAAARNRTYFEEGTLASYDLNYQGTTWQVYLQHYRPVDVSAMLDTSAGDEVVLLPHQFQLTSPAYQIKLRMNEWQPLP